MCPQAHGQQVAPLGFEPMSMSMDFKAWLWLHPVHQVLSNFSQDIDSFEMNSTEIDDEGDILGCQDAPYCSLL